MCLQGFKVFYRKAWPVPDNETPPALVEILVLLYGSTSALETVDVDDTLDALFDGSGCSSEYRIKSAIPKITFEFVHFSTPNLSKIWDIIATSRLS